VPPAKPPVSQPVSQPASSQWLIIRSVLFEQASVKLLNAKWRATCPAKLRRPTSQAGGCGRGGIGALLTETSSTTAAAAACIASCALNLSGLRTSGLKTWRVSFVINHFSFLQCIHSLCFQQGWRACLRGSQTPSTCMEHLISTRSASACRVKRRPADLKVGRGTFNQLVYCSHIAIC